MAEAAVEGDMKPTWAFSASFALLLTWNGASSAAEWEDRLQKLYPAAKTEGEVIFNTARVEELGGKEGLAQFTSRFPGIKITLSGLAGDQMPARLSAEEKAGKVSIDIFRSDANQAVALQRSRLLDTINIEQITDQNVTTYLDSTFVKLSDFISNFAYNTDLVKEADAPKSYEDLLDPKWKNRLAMDARGGQISHLLAAKIWDEAKFWDFVTKIKAQQPIWTSRNTEAMAKVTSGEGYVGTGSYDAITELRSRGAPVRFLFLSPSLSQVRGAGIPKGAQHANAAKLFLGWLLSPEGLAARDKKAVGTITPGTTLYDQLRAHNVNITFEATMDQIIARDEVERRVTAAWGVLK
jgi:iron(III) transport system substrate-binding protein